MKNRLAGLVALMLKEGTGRNLWSRNLNRRNQVAVTCTDGEMDNIQKVGSGNLCES